MRQEDFFLVEVNNAKSMSPAVSSGEEGGLISRTAAGNQAYLVASLLPITVIFIFFFSNFCFVMLFFLIFELIPVYFCSI